MLEPRIAIERIEAIEARLSILKDIIRESNKPVSAELTNFQIADLLLKAVEAEMPREQKVQAIATQLTNFYGVRNKPV